MSTTNTTWHPRKRRWPCHLTFCRVSTLVGVLTVIAGGLITGCGSEERQKTRTATAPDEGLVRVLTDANFDRQISESEGPVVVYFWADWCPRCLEMKPIISRLASEYSGRVRFGALDTEANRFTAEKHMVQVLPTILVFNDGTATQRLEGVATQDQLRPLLKSIGNEKIAKPNPGLAEKR